MVIYVDYFIDTWLEYVFDRMINEEWRVFSENGMYMELVELEIYE